MSIFHYSVDEKKTPNEQVAWLEGYCYCLKTIKSAEASEPWPTIKMLREKLETHLMGILIENAQTIDIAF